MNFKRLYKLLTALKAYQILSLLPAHTVPKKLKFGLALLFWIRKKAPHTSDGERLSLFFQSLGPIWIKLGQMLSTRHDLLPSEMATALMKLQDHVPAFDGLIAQQIIEKALNAPLETYFETFEIQPLASASIAQVHSATLKNSHIPVVIKVVRPNIEPIIQSDLALMAWFAQKMERKSIFFKRLHPVAVVADYKKTILNELDLIREAHNTIRLRQNFINSDMLYIPYVYADLCRQNILVEERVFGVPIADIDDLKQKNVNLKLLAERGVTVFFEQVFRDNFFHADMHPGNIFIDVSEPVNPHYIGIDCAIMGELTKEDQDFLAQTFIAFFNRDYFKIAKNYLDAGWVDEETDLYQLETALRHVCDPFFNKPLEELSFALVLLELFKVARQFGIEVQPRLVLLQKTLFYIEGLGRRLYPQLNLWATAKPFLESWYRQQYSLPTMAKQIKTDLPAWRSILLSFPEHQQNQKVLLAQLKKKQQQLSEQLELMQKNQHRYLRSLTVLIVAILGFVILSCFR